MIALRRNGHYLTLLPGTTVPWEVEDDMLDFDYVGQAFSWEFDIPRSANEQFFNFAAAPENPRNEFRVYNDFELTTDGFVFWRVNLILKASNRTLYKVELSNIPSKLIQKKDSKLSELITATFNIADGEYDDVIGPFNTQNSDMVFPYVLFFTEERRILRLIENTTEMFGIVPSFKVDFIIRECCKTIGVKFSNGYGANDDFNKLILVCNRNLEYETVNDTPYEVDLSECDNTVVVANHMPDYTFLQFLKEIAIWTGSSILIDDENGKIEIKKIERQFYGSEYVDLTEEIDPEALEIEQSPVSGYKLTMDKSEDTLLELSDPTLTGQYIGEYDNEAAFAATVLNRVSGDYAFCRKENMYYRFDTGVSGSLNLFDYARPVQNYQEGTQNVKELSISLLPAIKTRYTLRKRTGDFEITDNGSGKVRIMGWKEEDLVFGTDFEYYFQEEGEPLYDKGWYPHLASGGLISDGSYYIDIDLDSVIHDGLQVKEIWGRREENYTFIMVGSSLNNFKYGTGNTKFKGRLAIWRGMQTTIDTLGTYPMAAVDPYDNDTTVIGTHALRFQQTHGTVKKIYNSIFQFLRGTRIYKVTQALVSMRKLRQLYLLKVARFDGGKFRVRKISTSIGDDGPEFVEIEGYRI